MVVLFAAWAVDTMGTTGSVIGGVVNSLVIMILNNAYDGVAKKMNDYENHRSSIDYEDALTGKVFIFQFVNSYLSLLITAYMFGRVKIGDYEPQCESGPGLLISCMDQLASLILSTMITNVLIGNLLESLVPYLLHKQQKVFEPSEPFNPPLIT